MPIILLDEEPMSGNLTKTLSQQVVGRISWPLNQNQVLHICLKPECLRQ